MGAGGERIPNSNSSAEGEHLMVVGNVLEANTKL